MSHVGGIVGRFDPRFVVLVTDEMNDFGGLTESFDAGGNAVGFRVVE